PSPASRATLEAVRDADHVHRVAWATKGFELDTGLLPHKVAAEVLGAERPTAVLSGPTFAREVAAGLPTALTIASEHDDYAEDLARALTAENLRPYTSSDIVGVEVGGATKNVFAIGAGLCDGLGFRSEEHTSELQSRENLVCRLLLEKKKRTRLIST